MGELQLRAANFANHANLDGVVAEFVRASRLKAGLGPKLRMMPSVWLVDVR